MALRRGISVILFPPPWRDAGGWTDLTADVESARWTSTSPGGFSGLELRLVPGRDIPPVYIDCLAEGTVPGSVQVWADGVLAWRGHLRERRYSPSGVLLGAVGPLSWLGLRQDWCCGWLEGDSEQWFPHPRPYDRYRYAVTHELEIRLPKDVQTGANTARGCLYYWAHRGLPPHERPQRFWRLTADFDCQLGVSPATYHAVIEGARGGPFGTYLGSPLWNRTTTGTGSIDLSLAAYDIDCLRLRLYCESIHTPSEDKYITLSNVKITFAEGGSGTPTTPMTSYMTVATALQYIVDTLASSYDTHDPDGLLSQTLAMLMVRPYMSRAQALAEVAALAPCVVDYGYYDEDDRFRIHAVSDDPDKVPSRLLRVVDGSRYETDIEDVSGSRALAVRVVYAQDDPANALHYTDSRYRLWHEYVDRAIGGLTPGLGTALDVLDLSDIVMTRSEAERAGDEYLAWQRVCRWQGSLTVQGALQTVDGQVVPAAALRSGDYLLVQRSDGSVVGPAWVTACEYESETDSATLTVGGSERDYVWRRRSLARRRGPVAPRVVTSSIATKGRYHGRRRD